MNTTTDASTVFIVDDDAMVRRSLARVVAAAGMRVETFASAHEFLKSATSDRPGCLVLDLRLPGLSGLGLQQELAARNIVTPIIFLTGHGDIPTSVQAIKAGAVDFLTKPVQGGPLLEAIAKALHCDRQRRDHQAETDEIHQRLAQLTPREDDVFRLVIKGWLNKQIAGQLGISEKTVKIHRGRVMQKMKVTSVAELVVAHERIRPDAAGPA